MRWYAGAAGIGGCRQPRGRQPPGRQARPRTPPAGTGPGRCAPMGGRRQGGQARRPRRDAEGAAGRRVGRRRFRPVRQGVRSRRAPGPGRDHAGGRIRPGRCMVTEDRGVPDRLPPGQHSQAGPRMDRCVGDRQRVGPVPVDGPMGPRQASATGHAAASRRGRDPPARQRRRDRPRLRTFAPGRGRRQHGTARGQPGSDATSWGLAVAGHARPLRPPGGREPGSRRHPPAGRPLGVARSRFGPLIPGVPPKPTPPGVAIVRYRRSYGLGFRRNGPPRGATALLGRIQGRLDRGLRALPAPTRRIQAAATAARLDGAFSGHSPRIGMAVDLAVTDRYRRFSVHWERRAERRARTRRGDPARH